MKERRRLSVSGILDAFGFPARIDFFRWSVGRISSSDELKIFEIVSAR
jgi:hypothetical protein